MLRTRLHSPATKNRNAYEGKTTVIRRRRSYTILLATLVFGINTERYAPVIKPEKFLMHPATPLIRNTLVSHLSRVPAPRILGLGSGLNTSELWTPTIAAQIDRTLSHAFIQTCQHHITATCIQSDTLRALSALLAPILLYPRNA